MPKTQPHLLLHLTCEHLKNCRPSSLWSWVTPQRAPRPGLFFTLRRVFNLAGGRWLGPWNVSLSSGFESLTLAMRRKIWTSMARPSHLNTGEQYKEQQFCYTTLQIYISNQHLKTFVFYWKNRKKSQIIIWISQASPMWHAPWCSIGERTTGSPSPR